MNHLIKTFLVVIIGLYLISCNEKLNENYQKTVSQLDGFWSTNSSYEIDIADFKQFPDSIQNLTKNYLIEKIGKQKFDKIEYTYGYVSSNKPLNNTNKRNEIVDSLYGENLKESKELDAKYNYPIFSIGFKYSDLNKGIEEFDLTVIMDKNGKILKHINFPIVDSTSHDFIPIDSIHSILSRRKISSRKLELDLRFDRKNQSTFYYARTLIRAGSIAGPSCFPEYKEHFKVNAFTGEIVEYNIKNWIDYYSN